MSTRTNLLTGIGLMAAGAGLAVTIPHVKVDWSHAQAAPVTETKAALPPPSHAQVSEARSLGRTFAQVASQLSPSVVRISIAKTVKPEQGNNPMRFFFGPGMGGQGGDEGQREHGTGSGVVFDDKGFILTNNHVVEGADEVKVTFADGKTVPGKVVGTDPKTDLAVVKVEGVAVKAAKFGDSDKMEVGEWTIAIGNPMGLDHTVTVGVLSAKGRSGLAKMQYEDFLQTDAAINPGNSGGPLINLDGEIIGINTMILRGSGMGSVTPEGLNFAVSSSTAKPVAEQLMHGGKVRRPYIGIAMQDFAPEMAKAMGDKAPEHGAIVGNVQSGSPADKAGVKTGDVIIRVDGQSVDSSKSVQRTILTKAIGQRVELAVWRDGHEQKIATTTSEFPSDDKATSTPMQSSEAQHQKLGLSMQTLTPQIAQQLDLPNGTRGAIVAEVRPGSPADEAGLQRGDVFLSIDNQPVKTAEDATRLLGAQRSNGHFVRVQRGGMSAYIVIPGQ